MERIWEIFVWSMRALLAGVHPTVRDDKTSFDESGLLGDKDRARRAMQPLACRALLLAYGRIPRQSQTTDNRVAAGHPA